MNLRYAQLFAKLIAAPLQNVIGRPLQSVVYFVLHSDYAGFDIDAPNASGGCQGIHLTFANGELELDWDAQPLFRTTQDDLVSPSITYHLFARSASERQAIVRLPSEDDWSGLSEVNATDAIHWKRVCSEVLLGVTVWGDRLPVERFSPQAVELQFSSARVTIAVGMTAYLTIGDGDEMLVFTESEWIQRPSGSPSDALVAFWSAATSGG